MFENASRNLCDGGVDYCLMFGTLLRKHRHDDFIPWDNDIDIIIFDVEKYESRCIKKLAKIGYVSLTHRRLIENSGCSSADGQWLQYGYRIYANSGMRIPRKEWKFPWI